jgi:hypothetical protein
MTSQYLVNSANKLSALSKQFKHLHIQGDDIEAMELIKAMETKIKFMKSELENRMAVKA